MYEAPFQLLSPWQSPSLIKKKKKKVDHGAKMQSLLTDYKDSVPEWGEKPRSPTCHMQKQAICVYSDANQAGHCVPFFHAGCCPVLITTKVVLSPFSMNAAFEHTF